MRRQKIWLDRYSWVVELFYNVACQDALEITEALAEAGCGGKFLERAASNLCTGLDRGICYSDMRGRSIVVIGVATSQEQMVNSLVHELHHLVEHICEARGLDTRSEEAAYLVGDVAGEAWRVAKP